MQFNMLNINASVFKDDYLFSTEMLFLNISPLKQKLHLTRKELLYTKYSTKAIDAVTFREPFQIVNEETRTFLHLDLD